MGGSSSRTTDNMLYHYRIHQFIFLLIHLLHNVCQIPHLCQVQFQGVSYTLSHLKYFIFIYRLRYQGSKNNLLVLNHN